MVTWGFVPSYSGAITIGQPFTKTYNGVTYTFTAMYIVVGGAGDIVWLNALGEPQWLPGCQANQVYILGASQIVSSATVDGVSRTTTATNLTWMGSPSAA